MAQDELSPRRASPTLSSSAPAPSARGYDAAGGHRIASLARRTSTRADDMDCDNIHSNSDCVECFRTKEAMERLSPNPNPEQHEEPQLGHGRLHADRGRHAQGEHRRHTLPRHTGRFASMFTLLLFLVTSTTALSVPARTRSSSASAAVAASRAAAQRHAAQFVSSIKPKWINPCGIRPNAMKDISQHFASHFDIKPLSDAELFDNIILAAKNALRHSKVFKDDYVKKTFAVSNWWDHHETWKDMRYDWLPSWREVPKHLHEKASNDHLQRIKADTTLPNLYDALQKLAVGLEQVVIDQTLYDGNYVQEFNEAEYKLKGVLCELQVAMLEKKISHTSAPASRSIMSSDVRDIEDSSYRNLRDWYIYRDYINSLEYVVHSFDHLKRKTIS